MSVQRVSVCRRSLTGDGRCPSSQMSAAVADTPPKGRLPLKQTWEVNRLGKARLKRPRALLSFAHASVNQLYPKRRQHQRHTGAEEWVKRSDHHHHHHHQEKISGAIKCTDYKGPIWLVSKTLSRFEGLVLARSFGELEFKTMEVLCQAELSGF